MNTTARDTHDAIATRQTIIAQTRFYLVQLLAAIHREIDADPPFSAANEERRGELDQLRDMIDRRT